MLYLYPLSSSAIIRDHRSPSPLQEPGTPWTELDAALCRALGKHRRQGQLALARLYFAVITFAEFYFSPIALSLVSRMAPERSRSAVMGICLATSFTGNLFAGWRGGFWASLSNVAFFLLVPAIAALAESLIIASRGLVRDLLPD